MKYSKLLILLLIITFSICSTNISFAQQDSSAISYEMKSVTKTDGTVFSGVFLGDDGNQIHLRSKERGHLYIPKKEVLKIEDYHPEKLFGSKTEVKEDSISIDSIPTETVDSIKIEEVINSSNMLKDSVELVDTSKIGTDIIPNDEVIDSTQVKIEQDSIKMIDLSHLLYKKVFVEKKDGTKYYAELIENNSLDILLKTNSHGNIRISKTDILLIQKEIPKKYTDDPNLTSKNPIECSKYALYFNTGALLNIASLNFESNLFDGKKVSYYLRLNLGVSSYATTAGSASILFLRGKENNHLEFNAGVLLTSTANTGFQMNNSRIIAYPILSIGYRYQKADGGFMFRIHAGSLGVGIGLGRAF